MSRPAKDPQANAIARLVGTIEWRTPLTSDERDKAITLVQEGGVRNAYRFPGNHEWSVRMYAGGLSRTIGLVLDPMVALRFADMATLYFANSRMRAPDRNPRFNFSLERAKADLAAEDGAMIVIHRIEEYLKSVNALHDTSKPRPRAGGVANRLDRLEFMLEEQRKVLDQIAEHQKLLTQLCAKYAPLV